MELLTNIWLWLAIFLSTGSYILYTEYQKRQQIQAQFVVTGCLLVVFYAVCFLSGICTILNFIWRWIL
jgi:hypothetical protein